MRKLLQGVVLGGVMCMILGALSCASHHGEVRDGRVLKCYVGVNMKATVDEVAAEYERRTGVRVKTEVNNPRVLIGTIRLSEDADMFVCHDPFLAMLVDHGVKLKDARTVASLVPTIAVRKGNPLGIRDLPDLARPGVRVGVTDMNSMSGNIVAVMSHRAGVESQFRANVVKEYPAGRELAAALMAGELDAGIVWNVVIKTFSDKLEGVEISNRWRPERGVDDIEIHPELGVIELDYVRVNIAILGSSRRVSEARGFVDLLSSEVGKAAFRKNGFSPADPARPALLGGLDGKAYPPDLHNRQTTRPTGH